MVKYKFKILLLLFVALLVFNVTHIVMQNIHIPVYAFSIDQYDEYREASSRLNRYRIRHVTRYRDYLLIVDVDLDTRIYVPVREILVRRRKIHLINSGYLMDANSRMIFEILNER